MAITTNKALDTYPELVEEVKRLKKNKQPDRDEFYAIKMGPRVYGHRLTMANAINFANKLKAQNPKTVVTVWHVQRVNY